MDSGWHHFTSVLFHLVNTLLLFLILKRMTGTLWRSGFVAALFALHPLHVESVAWVAERKDVLSTFFLFLTLLSYIWYVERAGLYRYLLIILFFILGLMAKPMLVTLPFVLLLLDFWPLGRFPVGRVQGASVPPIDTPMGSKNWVSQARLLLREKIPFFAVAAVSSLITYLAQNSQNAIKPLTRFPLELRLANGLVSYISYIGKMLWPQDLAVFYPHPGQSLPIWKAALAGLLLLVISTAVIRLGRRYPYLPVGWLWYVGILVPVIGLVQVGEQAMADRYTYVPLIGLFIMIAWGVPDLMSRSKYRGTVMAVTAAVVLSTLMLITWKQLHHWKSSTTLFEHALDVTHNNSVAHFGLGNALLEEGKTAEAIHHYSEALRLDPGYVEVRINWGIALIDQGRPADAVNHFSEVLRINPHDGRAHLNLGVALARQGRTAEAIDHYFEASLQDPVNASIAYYNIACEYAKQNKREESIVWLEKAIRKGFRNWKYIKADKDLDNIRSSARYKELIKDH